MPRGRSRCRVLDIAAAPIAEVSGTAARAGTTEEAARDGDIVVVAIPLRVSGAVPVEPLAGKTVIDTSNYYWQRDGHIPELDDESTTTSEWLQAHLPQSHVVKAFNHILAGELTTDGRPAGDPGRRGAVLAGDDEGAKAEVAKLIDRFGFDPVDIGPLAEGWRIQRDTPGFGARHTADQLRAEVAVAKRCRDM
ncbi:NADP oxidoreductase [Jiangella aurantiaca]|uniref:NADP oxidoreductase n=1 Tax=Jiangella aurantiaca TaxID=2530373 RepID=A0A4R5A5H4_9ACTN|nr:NAD(P)-binding domain-containing protein [Jiangella aurantiaca]TDD67278.1 NADP oxidoreductase [Jiangella aurantiaca]